MNNESTRVLLALFVFGSIVLSLACGGGATNQNANTGGGTKASLSDLCPPGADFEAKKTALVPVIDKEISEKTLLNSQNNERFAYKIVEFGTAPNIGLELQLSGLLRGLRSKGEPTVEDFLDIIDEYMDRGCIQRVTFTKRAYNPGELTSDGFDWQACEYPNVYCTNGVCQPTCTGVMPANSANGMPNSNSSNSNHSNSNHSNSNTNSNGND